MKDNRKVYESQVLEQRIKSLINRLGQNHCIKPDGCLNEAFILAYLLRNCKQAAEVHGKLMTAFDALKKEDIFKKSEQFVSKETLRKIELYSEYLVRPAEPDSQSRFGNIFTGTILKIPKTLPSNYFPGDEWKILLGKEDDFKIGDQIVYNSKNNIILDNECLHLVGYIVGKILK